MTNLLIHINLSNNN